MGIVLMEGFRCLPSAASRYTVLNASNGVSTWSRQANRSGGYSLRHSSSVASDSVNYTGRLRVGINNTFSVGFAANHRTLYTGSPSSATCGMQVTYSNDNFAVSVAMGTGAPIAWGTGSGVTGFVSTPTVVDSSPTTIGWHWWNLVGIYAHATAGFVRVYRDGTLIGHIQPDTTDTGPSSLASFNIFPGNASATSGFDIADLIVRDDTTVIPDSRIDVLSPTSDSAASWARSAGSTNFSLIDDAGPTVDASDYISANAAGVTDTYGLTDLPFNPTTVYAVGARAVSRKPGAGIRDTCVMVNGAEGPTQSTGENGTIDGYWETNPSGGAAWTKVDIDAMTAGIRTKT